MHDEQRALSLLGLAMRAGQIISGDDMCEKAARRGRVAVVLLDAEASGNTKEKYQSICGARQIPLHMISPGALARAIGKENRMVAGVTGGPLANQVKALLA